MTFELIIVLVLVVVAVILFATEKIPVDLVALIIMATLLGSGIISPEEGLSGFSNPATVTVGAMFVLSAGLFKTGAVNSIGRILTHLSKRDFGLALITMMITIGAISAFINNTAAVAVFLPIVLGVARETKVSASKLLMPCHSHPCSAVFARSSALPPIYWSVPLPSSTDNLPSPCLNSRRSV